MTSEEEFKIRSQQIGELVLEGKIESLVGIDNHLTELMILYAESEKLDRSIGIQKWQDTVWHKTIKKEIDRLSKLKEELDK